MGDTIVLTIGICMCSLVDREISANIFIGKHCQMKKQRVLPWVVQCIETVPSAISPNELVSTEYSLECIFSCITYNIFSDRNLKLCHKCKSHIKNQNNSIHQARFHLLRRVLFQTLHFLAFGVRGAQTEQKKLTKQLAFHSVTQGLCVMR